MRPRLKQPCKDIILKYRYVVITRQVYCRLQCHCLQTRADMMYCLKSLTKMLPGHCCFPKEKVEENKFIAKSDYLRKPREAIIWRRWLFQIFSSKGGDYLRGRLIEGRLLFKEIQLPYLLIIMIGNLWHNICTCHFWDAFCLCFKMNPGAKTFYVNMSSICTKMNSLVKLIFAPELDLKLRQQELGNGLFNNSHLISFNDWLSISKINQLIDILADIIGFYLSSISFSK